MSKKLPTREALVRFAEAAENYRAAFSHVQDVLASIDLGRIPGWVFAIDRLTPEELHKLSPALREAEERRRVNKVALHSLAELIALEDEGEGELDSGTEALMDSLEVAGSQDNAQLRKLDRFISVVNMAKAGGCIYVNGTFQPVSGPGTPQGSTVPPGPGELPDGAHIELAEPPPIKKA